MSETINYDPAKEHPAIEMMKKQELDFHKAVLGHGMLWDNDKNTTDYQLDKSGNRLLTKASREEIPLLVNKFKSDPKETLAIGRNNILEIMQDKRLSEQKRKERVKRYTDAFLDLQIRLDHEAFPPSDSVKKGVPEYIPDGLSDMGSDDEIDPSKRSREKIRIDKKKIFEQSKDFIYETFSQDYTNYNLEQIKKDIIAKVAYFVYAKMPYNYQKKRSIHDIFGVKSVPINEIRDQRLAVCRHHALYTQVLLQTFGITSRLLKCDLGVDNESLGPHVANLVRINNKWYLLDVTNPDEENGHWKIFTTPLLEKHIDPNNQSYEWIGHKTKNNKVYKYRTRNNMYYRIRKN